MTSLKPAHIIMFPILQLGPLALQMPGLILLVGFWLGLNLAEKHAPRHHIHPDWVYNLAFIALLAGILGARLTYALQHLSAFTASPGSLLSLNPGLLDPFGGAAIGLVAAFVYGQRKRIPFWPMADALTPAAAVMGIAIPLANLASGAGYGVEASLPWSIELWGASRHPSQVYEGIAGLVILMVLWPGPGLFSRRVVHQWVKFPGGYALAFLVLAAFARLWLEAFRGDSLTILNGWRVVQLVAWGALAGGLWGLYQLSQTDIETKT